MRKTQKIGGFAVEALPYTRGNQTEWSVWLADLPHVRESAVTLSEARKALTERWEKMVAAYRAAGESVPRPIRRRGNRRILDTIQELGERRGSSVF
jgi:predicted RNase H-like HicB family nuclease